MTATLAVIAREMMARRELLLLAIAAAVIVSLMPLMPGLESYDPADIRTVGSTTLAVLLGWGLSLYFGATIFGSDLSEGRLGFFFSRPLSGLAVWWGRVIAVLALIWLVEAIVLLPSIIGGGVYVSASSEVLLIAVVAYVIAPLLLHLLAHAIGIMARARTAWLFLDVAGFTLFAFFAWLSVLPFLAMFAKTALWVIVGGLAASLVIALAVGGACGLVVGRVDLRRTHSAMSLALWGTVALCSAAVTVYSGWLRDFGPADFDDVDVVSVAPNGRWVEAIGRVKGRLDVTRRYLVSTTDNRWLQLPGVSTFQRDEVKYSRDGSTAMWRGAGLGEVPRGLWWADLGRPDPSARPTNILVARGANPILSADGSRVAILEEGTISVYELDGERMISASRLPDDSRRTAVFFPTRDTLRVIARTGKNDDHALLLADVDANTGEFTRNTEIDALAKESWIAVDAAWKRLVVWTKSEPGRVPLKRLYDATNGRYIRSMHFPGFPRFLRDGRIVILAEGDDGTTRLVVEPFEGGKRIVHELNGAKELRLGGEAVPNGVVLSRFADPSDRTQGLHVELFDVVTGEVRIIGSHLRRVLPWFQWHSGTAGVVFWYADQPAAHRFFIDQSGALVRWEPETGELIRVVGGRGFARAQASDPPSGTETKTDSGTVGTERH